jgi:pimeloyl-ACP methyl ester carboxylesterase
VIDGTFDAGGHGLYLKCQGSQPPTIVYMHGSITDPSVVPHANGEQFLASLGEEHRVCVYDRRNLGASDTVDAPQLPEDAIGDMHELLAAADVQPPYVLLGASFGGHLSYLYANTYPDEVVGMVLLDSQFPDELSLEHLFKPADRYKAFSAEDERESLERISHFKVFQASQPFIGQEPSIPVTYLSSIPEGYDANDYGIPEYDRQILDLQEAFVERFSPGRDLRVDAPHFMEVAIPDEIIEELRRVIAKAGY